MTPATAYEELMGFVHDTAALEQIAERIGWDQRTMMPPDSGNQRGEEMATIEGILHARRSDPRIGDWLDRVVPSDAVARAQVARIRRDHMHAMRVPEALAREIARVTSLAHGIWIEARASDDVAAFLPTLSEIVRLKREEGAALADGADSADPYDALLDVYEPGMTGATIEGYFNRMRPRLLALRDRILGADDQPVALEGSFSADAQMRLARDLATAFGFDWSRGRLDLSVHPFTAGSGDDVRITTRISEADPFDCFYSTIHEAGHACYEQNVDADYLLTPIGGGVSMGVHESQSRICENQLGRSRAFAGWLHAEMEERFGAFGIEDADAFFATVNRVRPGFIRTEADELHYNLHIMLRFDLERALIRGELDVADVEAAWNDRFLADFAVAVDLPRNGLLQDVHWASGLFGYFPTYALGNIYAGCLYRAMRDDVADLDDGLAAGDPAPAMAWLHEHVQRHGGLFQPHELITDACGAEPDPEPLLDYLDDKFAGIYRL